MTTSTRLRLMFLIFCNTVLHPLTATTFRIDEQGRITSSQEPKCNHPASMRLQHISSPDAAIGMCMTCLEVLWVSDNLKEYAAANEPKEGAGAD